MEWVPHDEPTVQRQRGKWTVRQGGYDPATDRHIVPLIGAIRLRDLSAEIVDAWILDPSTAPEGTKPRLGPTPADGELAAQRSSAELTVLLEQLVLREPPVRSLGRSIA